VRRTVSWCSLSCAANGPELPLFSVKQPARPPRLACEIPKVGNQVQKFAQQHVFATIPLALAQD